MDLYFGCALGIENKVKDGLTLYPHSTGHIMKDTSVESAQIGNTSANPSIKQRCLKFLLAFVVCVRDKEVVTVIIFIGRADVRICAYSFINPSSSFTLSSLLRTVLPIHYLKYLKNT